MDLEKHTQHINGRGHINCLGGPGLLVWLILMRETLSPPQTIKIGARKAGSKSAASGSSRNVKVAMGHLGSGTGTLILAKDFDLPRDFRHEARKLLKSVMTLVESALVIAGRPATIV